MQWFTSLDAWVQALIAALMMYLMTTLGAASVFFSKKINKTVITALTALAAGIMIAASFFSLLLPAIEYESKVPSYITVTVGFLLGGAFIILSDYGLSRSKLSFESIGDKKNALLFIAVTLHNIPEGMAVGVVFSGLLAQDALISAAGAFALSIGIAIQNFPEGAIISMPLKTGGMSGTKAFLYGTASGVVEPIAAVVTILLTGIIYPALPYLLSFAAGAMIYVVVEELIPESQAGENTDIGTIGVALGFALMMVLDVALG